MNSGQKEMCRSQQHLIFALPGCASDSDTSAPMEMPAMNMLLSLFQGCIYEGVTIQTGTQKLANNQ